MVGWAEGVNESEGGTAVSCHMWSLSPGSKQQRQNNRVSKMREPPHPRSVPPLEHPCGSGAETRVSSRSTFLLDLICAGEGDGQTGAGLRNWGAGSQGERCAKKGEGMGAEVSRGAGRVECHKATAVQGCLSLQGSTPLLSW